MDDQPDLAGKNGPQGEVIDLAQPVPAQQDGVRPVVQSQELQILGGCQGHVIGAFPARQQRVEFRLSFRGMRGGAFCAPPLRASGLVPAGRRVRSGGGASEAVLVNQFHEFQTQK